MNEKDIIWPECETGTWIPQNTAISANIHTDTDRLLLSDITDELMPVFPSVTTLRVMAV